MIIGGHDDTHTCRLYHCHRHLHRIVKTSQVVSVGGLQSFVVTTDECVSNCTICNIERDCLLSVISFVVRITCHGDGAIALTSVGQDNVTMAVVPGNTDACHYSIVQLVLEVTVNEAEV